MQSVQPSSRPPLIIALCGLPARGKSYLSRKLCIYLRWIGIKVKVFNAGDYRRKVEGAGQPAEYFDIKNETARNEREAIAKLCFDDLLSWLKSGGEVAIFDATNTTVYRRNKILNWCIEGKAPPALFLESICTDEELLERNYRLKLHNADYKNIDRDVALQDFKKRVEMYEKIYETVGENKEEEDISYIKVFNVGKKVIINNCFGWLQSQVVSILQNFHISPRRILLTRHGQSVDCITKIIGRDATLTENGVAYSKKLLSFMESLQACRFDSEIEDNVSDSEEKSVETANSYKPFVAFSSVLKRAVNTIDPLKNFTKRQVVYTTALNELNAGLFEGFTQDEIQEKFPEEYNARLKSKPTYRYPGGESYMDVVQRLQPIVLDLERQKDDVLIVSHTAPIRALLAYFLGKGIEDMVNFDTPLQTVFEIRPCPFECVLIAHDLS